MPQPPACSNKNLIGPEIMRRRDRLDWTQSDLAVKVQLAGWDIDRSQLSKIECRLVHLSDFSKCFSPAYSK